VKGAFARAVAATTAATSGRLVARRIPTAMPLLRTEVPDPFESFRLGATQLRTRLAALPRATLLQIIATHDLNPAGKSLAWLTNAQLVTFIVTAVDAQIRMGKTADLIRPAMTKMSQRPRSPGITTSPGPCDRQFPWVRRLGLSYEAAGRGANDAVMQPLTPIEEASWPVAWQTCCAPVSPVSASRYPHTKRASNSPFTLRVMERSPYSIEQRSGAIFMIEFPILIA
jgi:hypothetical protein